MGMIDIAAQVCQDVNLTGPMVEEFAADVIVRWLADEGWWDERAEIAVGADAWTLEYPDPYAAIFYPSAWTVEFEYGDGSVVTAELMVRFVSHDESQRSGDDLGRWYLEMERLD